MKKYILFKIVMLFVVATFSIYQVNAQTKGSGAMTNTCGFGANDGGVAGNTSVGCGAGKATMSGANNTSIGESAGNSLATGANNSFFGTKSGFLNSSGGNNAYLGYLSGYTNTSGTANTCVGLESGYYNTTNYNTFIGYTSGFNNSTGTQNTFLGYSSGLNNTSSGYNTFIGSASGHNGNYTSGDSYNTGVGYNVSFYNVTGLNNTLLGAFAGYGSTGNSYSKDVFIGYKAGYSTTTGIENTALGNAALYSNNISSDNTAIGFQALYNNTAKTNTAVGEDALYSNTTGEYNTAVGQFAIQNNSAGVWNTAVGCEALALNTNDYNTAVGYYAGQTVNTGSENTLIGCQADVCSTCSAITNASAFGYGATALATDGIYLGNAATNLVTSAVGSWSDGRFKFNIQQNVKGLEFINKLQPVTYQMDTKKLDGFINNGRNKTVIVPHTQTESFTDSTGTHTITITTYDTIKSKNPNANLDFVPSTAIIHSGFIAQDVAKAAKASNFNCSIVSTPADSTNNVYTLSYQEIVVPLVKAVQELSKTVDSLKAANATGSNNRTINNNSNNDTIKNRQNIILSLPDVPTLGEPQPNPNSGSTQIAYYLPQNTSNSKIIFTDMLGKVMDEKPLQAGYGLLNIDTQNLPSGIYTYTLVIDEKAFDTKKMMRNK